MTTNRRVCHDESVIECVERETIRPVQPDEKKIVEVSTTEYFECKFVDCVFVGCLAGLFSSCGFVRCTFPNVKDPDMWATTHCTFMACDFEGENA